jgi:hypothetical protein
MLRRHLDRPETVRFDPRFSAIIHVDIRPGAGTVRSM